MLLTNSSYDKPGERPEMAEIVWTVVYFVGSFTVFVANVLTVITFMVNRHLIKRSMYCLVNLAVADMVVGLGTFISNTAVLSIFGIKALIDKQFLYHRSTSVIIQTSVYYFTMGATMLALIIVAFERMMATLWPLRHRTLKSSAYILFIASPWICALTIGISSSLGNQQNKRNYLGSPWIVLKTLILCTTYIAIYIKFKSRKTQPQFYAQRSPQQEKRLVATVLMVTIASICTWIPMGLVLLIRDIDVIPVPYQAHFGAVAILMMNSLVNPVIYMFRMKGFRKAVHELVCRCCPGSQPHQINQVELSVIGSGKCNITVSDQIKFVCGSRFLAGSQECA